MIFHPVFQPLSNLFGLGWKPYPPEIKGRFQHFPTFPTKSMSLRIHARARVFIIIMLERLESRKKVQHFCGFQLSNLFPTFPTWRFYERP